MGVSTYDVHAPDIAPATTRPVKESLLDDGSMNRPLDLKKFCARLYVKNSVAFSAMAPSIGGDRPCPSDMHSE